MLWNGQWLTVEADAAEIDALVGMAILDGCVLKIEVLKGGSVTLEALP